MALDDITTLTQFQASQAVHEADGIAIPYFSSQVHSICVCGPQVHTLVLNLNLLTLVWCLSQLNEVGSMAAA